MEPDQRGFYHAWEALLMDFEEVLVGNAEVDPLHRTGGLAYPIFDRPFSIVKLFHHPAAEMGLELRADGNNAIFSMFRQDPESDPGTHTEPAELGNVRVRYDEILDMPDEVMAQVLSFLPQS